MTDLLACLPLALVRDLGWTLLHFLWQGLLLAAMLNAILPLCRSAVARHNWALAILALMALAPAATFLSLHDFTASNPVTMSDTSAAAAVLPAAPATLPWTDWLVLFWLAGIALLSLRAFGGWYVARSLTHRGTLPASSEFLARCQRLQRRLGVNGRVRFLLSQRIPVPLVIGWLRPVVLVPVSALSGLTPQQLDALILHELAHIRRLDTAINILLVAVETILFYHPATWWVSRQVRIAREQCCDDLAVSACGNAAVYVEALTSLESWRPATGIALAANDGSLKSRAARLLDAPADRRRFPLSALAGLAFLGLVAGSVAMAQTGTQTDSHFAICIVDESVDPNARSGPPGDVRVPMMVNGKPTYVWVKQESRITETMLAGAKAGTNRNGQAVIDIRLTPEGQKQLAALTRANVGHRFAMIVNGTALTTPMLVEPILGPTLSISAFHSQAEARAAAAQMMAAAKPVPPSSGPTAGKPSSNANPSDDKNPVMLRPIPGTHTLPPYPTISARLGESGTVTLTVTIGTDGAPRDITVLRSSGSYLLDNAAIDHVKSVWRWAPPTRNGKPVVAHRVVEVVFNLAKAEKRPDPRNPAAKKR